MILIRFYRSSTKGLESWHQMVTGRSPPPMTLPKKLVCCDVLFAIGSLLSPLLIGHLIFMLMSPETHQNNILHGCVLATAMAVTTLVGTLGVQHNSYAGELMGIRLSNAVKGLVYRKVSTRRVTVSSPAFPIICAPFTFSHPAALALVSYRHCRFEEYWKRVRVGLG